MENVDWRHLTTGSSGLTGQARSQLNRMLEEERIYETNSHTRDNRIGHYRVLYWRMVWNTLLFFPLGL